MSAFEPLEFPAWIRWGKRRGAFVGNRGIGPNGRPLCGWCDSECEGRRTAWCSDACSRRFSRVWSWGALSKYIRARDNSTCQRCGTTDPGVPTNAVRYHAWEVDHIVPISKGGDDNPENLRLLCRACHLAVGREQRGAA